MDRGPVKLREANIQSLINLYKDTYRKLTREIITASESGKIQKARVMARINFELGQLNIDVKEWVKKELPQYYLDGANQAIQDLRALGVDLNKTTGLASINQEAISALLDSTNVAFAQSIQGISRNSRQILDDALKQQINYTLAQGKLEGQALQAITAMVKQRLADSGLIALVDRAGRGWTFDTYAEMLVRTKAVEARNQGLANRMLQNGYDLVQVSNHASEHKACAVWEGKILSLSGATPTGTLLKGGYKVAGTLQTATEAGLFHPNCEHAINVFNPELAAKTEAYDNPYNYREAA